MGEASDRCDSADEISESDVEEDRGSSSLHDMTFYCLTCREKLEKCD